MALRDVWWMQKPEAVDVNEFQYGPPHRHWPWNRAPAGIKYTVLEEDLQNNKGSTCMIDIYRLKSHTKWCRWSYQKSLTTADQILDELLNRKNAVEPVSLETVTYIIKDVKREAIQALGYHLSLTPYFFDLGHERLTVGGHAGDGNLFYTLQFMEKYPPGVMPAAARKSYNTMRCQFRTAGGHDGAFDDHVWHITRIRLMFVRGKNDQRCQAFLRLDSADESIAEAFRVLMTRDDDAPEVKGYTGLDKLVGHTIYVVNATSRVFLNEAGAHLKILSENCVDDNLTSVQQLKYTRELHQLSSLWPRVRRRLQACKELAEQIATHPFFLASNHNDGRDALDNYMLRKIKVIDDQIILCNELVDKTNLLISLIFNIATLQDTKAAVEESRAANRLASSIGRVTMLTFVYLPLTLASSIFGMNVSHITGGEGNSPLWAYFVLAASLMCATFGGWFIWSQLLKREERRKSKPATTEQKV